MDIRSREMEDLPTIQEFLLAELFSRQKKNAAYSRRAFARDISVSPGFLSLVLSGKKSLSEKRAARIAGLLSWNVQQSRTFQSVVRCQNLKGTDEGAILAAKVQHDVRKGKLKLFDLEIQHFQTISEWFHFAIVELTDLPEFDPSPEWVAARLGISRSQAREAMARLLTLGLLQHRDDKLVRGHLLYRVKGVPSEAIRSFHSQHLAHAVQALHKQDVDRREITGTTVSVNPRKIAVAKRMIREFVVRFNLAMGSGSKSHVYHLGVQFFALDGLANERPSIQLPPGKPLKR